MDFLRTLLPFPQQPGRRRWGLPAQNAAAIGSNSSSSSPVLSFFNGGGRGGSVLPGGGVLGGECDVDGDLSRNPVRSGGKAVVGDSAVVLNKASLSKDSVPSSHPLKNTKATDYATPEKYLENPEKIPSYYVFQSNMVTDEDLKPGMLRNLEVDKRLTLPTRTHIRFLITATDVIHSWAVPSLGIKADAIPGRMQKVTTFIQREGVFYGQCSELCGSLHGFMPIVVEAVSPETYAAHAKKWYRDE